MEGTGERPDDDKITTQTESHIEVNKFPSPKLEELDSVEVGSETNNSEACNSDSIQPDRSTPEQLKKLKINNISLYTEDVGPRIYNIKSDLATSVVITKNLPDVFKFMPVNGRPNSKDNLVEFQRNRVREFVGFDLDDEDFNKLAYFCSSDHLKTGAELKMPTSHPIPEPISSKILETHDTSLGDNLCVVKKLKMRNEKDSAGIYSKILKYRGLRCIPPPQEDGKFKIDLTPLEPGKDLVFRVRIYRPFWSCGRERNYTRTSLFFSDIVLLGRQKLSQLRDRIVCANDIGTRVDFSNNPYEVMTTSAKTLFPSGFLFINNTFYVDTRPGCKDNANVIRQWALRRFGNFPSKDLTDFTLDQIPIRLGHPEVYVHQGNCEHLFTFSEVRLLHPSDPLQQSLYPYHTFVSQNQTIYCTTCAEFCARWIVTECQLVPFEPAFFCDTCFRLYLYKDGEKITDFKAFSYRGNEINQLKPMVN